MSYNEGDGGSNDCGGDEGGKQRGERRCRVSDNKGDGGGNDCGSNEGGKRQGG